MEREVGFRQAEAELKSTQARLFQPAIGAALTPVLTLKLAAGLRALADRLERREGALPA